MKKFKLEEIAYIGKRKVIICTEESSDGRYEVVWFNGNKPSNDWIEFNKDLQGWKFSPGFSGYAERSPRFEKFIKILRQS